MKDTQTWIRSEEALLADELKQRNLPHANQIHEGVTYRRTIYSVVVKRIIDFIIASFALVVTLPINIILAILTMKELGRPLFYCQTRMGKGGKPFTLIKFRNMTNEVDSRGELLPPSQRVTKSGRIIRKYSLDELLNFWSVLKGDMSIIGPRPMPIQYCERLSVRHQKRNLVRPGLLCPITKEFKKKYPFPDPFSRYQAEFETEIWYVENISFKIDLMMLVLLFRDTFDMSRRSKNANAASPFIGYDENGFAVSKKMYEESRSAKEEHIEGKFNQN